MDRVIIKNGLIINRGTTQYGDVLIEKGRIIQVGGVIDKYTLMTIDATGKWIIPGVIDDQVHFREPGLTHKATIGSEARAGIAGGVTSFMEMPNTKPPALTQELLEEKYQIAAQSSLANFSFYMGVSNENFEEVMRTDPSNVCGLKIFMGSSTGNMLVDNEQVLERIFSNAQMLIATHCEDEDTIKFNLEKAINKFGEDIPFDQHPIIRSIEGCYISSSKAVQLAKKHNTRLHILHISSGKEVNLFDAQTPLSEKRITSEVCVHHLTFDSSQYTALGSRIKCNPAIKSKEDQTILWQGLVDNHLDVIATDHAPHTREEKNNKYLNAPSGLPLLQHALPMMINHYHQGKISPEKIVEKMCHAPAICFKVKDRGYLDAGMFADVVIIDPNKTWQVTDSNIFYQCGWSPLEGQKLKGKAETTLVNGQVVFHEGIFYEPSRGMRLEFNA